MKEQRVKRNNVFQQLQMENHQTKIFLWPVSFFLCFLRKFCKNMCCLFKYEFRCRFISIYYVFSSSRFISDIVEFNICWILTKCSFCNWFSNYWKPHASLTTLSCRKSFIQNNTWLLTLFIAQLFSNYLASCEAKTFYR